MLEAHARGWGAQLVPVALPLHALPAPPASNAWADHEAWQAALCRLCAGNHEPWTLSRLRMTCFKPACHVQAA